MRLEPQEEVVQGEIRVLLVRQGQLGTLDVQEPLELQERWAGLETQGDLVG